GRATVALVCEDALQTGLPPVANPSTRNWSACGPGLTTLGAAPSRQLSEAHRSWHQRRRRGASLSTQSGPDVTYGPSRDHRGRGKTYALCCSRRSEPNG